MGKIRIGDVADKAGVSKSTVSQYLNGRFNYMSAETKKRIRSTIEELNYIPNPLAQSLKTDRTRTIGVIVRDITGFFTSRVLRGIDDFCKEYKYDVLIHNTDFDPATERQSLKKLRQLRVDGIIIASSGENNKIIAREVSSGFPLVQLHLEYDDLKTSIVLADNRAGAFVATEHLLKLGHKRICLQTIEYQTSRTRRERFEGYCDALKKYGITHDPGLIHFWNRETGLETATEEILSMPDPPTAFLSLYLAITSSLLSDFRRLNVRIPEDISLIAFDEIPMAEHLKVPVTVIAQSPYEMGRESARILLDNIEKKDSKIVRSIIPCRLIERESCAPIHYE